MWAGKDATARASAQRFVSGWGRARAGAIRFDGRPIHRAAAQLLVWLLRRFGGTITDRFRRARDLRRRTYARETIGGALTRLLPRVEPAWLEADRATLAGASRRFLEHRHDLLGSGWTRVRFGMHCRGVVGASFPPAPAPAIDPEGRWLAERVVPSNLPSAQACWRLVDRDYAPLDWHIDFKSGFRWAEKTWYRDVDLEPRPGVDVKVPWELARMQHLPQLAYSYALAAGRAPGFEPPERYAREVRNQILDFIARNPPRFGVNWRCAMDVAIRAANWLVAYDLLRAAGATFDEGFDRALGRSILEHGRHLRAELEWHPAYRGNHYLANLGGLLFAAAYLPVTRETRGWLRFSSRELLAETRRQFLPDGGGFEASTGYHRLSAEIVIYATALMLALRRIRPELADALPNVAGAHLSRIERMAEFTIALTRPDGGITQIGDSDSGRFLKLTPAYRRMTVAEAVERYADLDGYDDLPGDADYWDEDLLDHRHLVAAAAGLVGRPDFTARARGAESERRLVAALAGRHLSAGGEPVSRPAPSTIGSPDALAQLLERLRALPAPQRQRFEIRLGGPLLAAHRFSDFGVFVFRGATWYLAVRCGPIGLNGLGAHAHNDALAVELTDGGHDLARDPGSYLYTPSPLERDRYRSVQAHFAPRVAGREPGSLARGLFRLGNEARARCLYFDGGRFLGCHGGYGAPVYRHVAIADGRLTIEDFSEAGPLEPLALSADALFVPVPFSPKYGCRLR
jgi:hypothetical protein